MRGQNSHNCTKFVALNCCNLERRMEEEAIDQYLANFDVICLSETRTGFAHLTGSALENFTAINSCIESDPEQLVAKVGVLILVRDSMVENVNLERGHSKQVVWMSLKAGNDRVIICGAVYLASESADYHTYEMFDDINRDIAQFRTRFDNVSFCLMGDFNSRTSTEVDAIVDDTWFEEMMGLQEAFGDDTGEGSIHIPRRQNKDSGMNGNGRRLLKLCIENDLIICNGRTTDDHNGEITCYNRNGGTSTVDYALVSKRLFPQVDSFRVDDFNPLLSDAHCPVMLTMSLDQQWDDDDDDEEEDSPPQRRKFKWNEEIRKVYAEEYEGPNLDEFRKELRLLEESPTQEGVDSICSKLRGTLISNAERAGALLPPRHNQGGKRKAFRPRNSWFDGECNKARKEFHNVRRRAVRLPDIERRMQVRAAAQVYREVIRRKKVDAERQLRKKMHSLYSGNTKEYWRLLKGAGQQKRKNVKSRDADAFREHFKRLSGAGADDQPEPNIDCTNDSALNREFTVEELRAIFLPNGKACGLDEIHNEFLRNCPNDLMELVADLFNVILRTGLIPDDWCTAIIMPLFKKGSRSNPDHYRGISLLSCLSKLFTNALNIRLSKFAEEEAAIGEEQAGFRKGYCTSDHIFSLHVLIEIYKFSSKKLFCAFIDYKKAFDMVDRTALWGKVLELGIDGKILRVIFRLYQRAKAVVRTGGKLSDPFPCNIGVRQGESLSPLLFAFFLNDLNNHLATCYNGLSGLTDEFLQVAQSDEEIEMFMNLFLFLYADDTIILAESAEELQKALNGLHVYCLRWGLEVNLDKTKVVIFGKRRVQNHPGFLFGSEEVKVVDEYIYLGITFYCTGNFAHTISRQILQASKAMNALMWRCAKMNLTPDLIIDLYSKMIIPIITYGSEVWGFSDLTEVEKFHRECLKRILGVAGHTASCCVYGETGSAPLSTIIGQKMTGFWLKIINGKQSKIVRFLYHLFRKKHYNSDFVSEWLHEMHWRMEEVGMEVVWENEGQGMSSEVILSSMKVRSAILAEEQWRRCVREQRGNDIYKTFKMKLEVEPYLSADLSRKCMRNVARFRCRSNFLPAASFERFRDEEYRPTCPMCASQRADEVHFLCRCPFFGNARERWCGSARLDEACFVSMMRDKDADAANRTARFISDIVETFDIFYEVV